MAGSSHGREELQYISPEGDIASFANQLARQRLYEYSQFDYKAVLKRPIEEYVSPPSIWLRGAEALAEVVSPETPITDTATGGARLPLILARDFGFKTFSGYDLHPDNFFLAEEEVKQLNTELPSSEPVNFDFTHWDHDNPSIEVLPARNGSLSVIVSAFSVYHMTKLGPERFINGLYQKLEEGGYCLFGTRNPDNQNQLWADARIVADAIGAKLDPVYYELCDEPRTIELAVKAGFRVERVIQQKAELWVPIDKEPRDQEGWLEWREALKAFLPSMQDNLYGLAPDGGALQDAIDELIYPRFVRRAAAYGTEPQTEAEAPCIENQTMILVRK